MTGDDQKLGKQVEALIEAFGRRVNGLLAADCSAPPSQRFDELTALVHQLRTVAQQFDLLADAAANAARTLHPEQTSHDGKGQPLM